jgi:hypothetical protein
MNAPAPEPTPRVVAPFDALHEVHVRVGMDDPRLAWLR